MELAFHLQALTVRLDRQVPERRSFIRKDMPVHQVLQAGHVHRHLCGLKVQDVRTRVVEYGRRFLVAADHRPAQARDVENDSIVNVQADVLHLELNALGCEAHIVRRTEESASRSSRRRWRASRRVQPQPACRFSLTVQVGARPIKPSPGSPSHGRVSSACRAPGSRPSAVAGSDRDRSASSRSVLKSTTVSPVRSSNARSIVPSMSVPSGAFQTIGSSRSQRPARSACADAIEERILEQRRDDFDGRVHFLLRVAFVAGRSEGCAPGRGRRP